jgi:uncharacterized membrane protein YbhN (UPF0104 family)
MTWKSKRVWLILQGAVTLALLVLLFESFDWRAFGAVYARLPIHAYLVSLGVVFLGQAMYAWRWRVLLRAGEVPVTFLKVFAST